MRIVFSNIANYDFLPLLNASVDVFKNTSVWNSIEPPNDFFYKTKPTIIFCDPSCNNGERFLKYAVEQKSKLVLLDNHDHQYKPDLLCVRPDISKIMMKYIECNYYKYYDCADTVRFNGGTYNYKYSSDIGYVSSVYKKDSVYDILKSISIIPQRYKTKIIGSLRIPTHNYLGTSDDKTTMNFLRSCKICLDINGDNLLNNAANGIFTLSSIPNMLFEQLSIENVEKYIDNEDEKKNICDKNQKLVLEKDTGYHRLKDVLTLLNEENDSIKLIDDKITELICSLEQ